MSDTVVTNIPEYSNAINSVAKLLINDRPLTEFFIKEFNVPSIDYAEEIIPGGTRNIKNPGNEQEFGSLTLTIFLDEEYMVYKEIFDWLVELAGDEGSSAKARGSILVFNSSKTQTKVKFDFYGLFPTNLPELPFNNYGNEELTLSINFSYDKFVPNFK